MGLFQYVRNAVIAAPSQDHNVQVRAIERNFQNPKTNDTIKPRPLQAKATAATAATGAVQTPRVI